MLKNPPQLTAVLTLLHLSLYRHGVGLTGDEDLFSYRLTSSLDDSWVNALTLSSFTPVQPVALAVFTWPSSMHQCLAIDLTGGRLAVQPVLILVQFSTLLSSFFDSYFARALYSSLGPRMIHLKNSLVSLIALSFDHQNHKKWSNRVMFVTLFFYNSCVYISWNRRLPIWEFISFRVLSTSEIISKVATHRSIISVFTNIYYLYP